MKHFIILLLISCTYTDPYQARITFYQCEKDEVLAVRTSDDYDHVTLELNEETLVLHRFITPDSDGYRTDEYVWLTKGKKATLADISNGKEKFILKKCKIES